MREGLTPRDINNLEFIHNYVAPWFLLNEITMLKHLSVAYFENHSSTPAPHCPSELYELLHRAHNLPTNEEIQFFEHITWQWRCGLRSRDDEPTPIKPMDGLEVVLVCAPRKVLKEVDLRG